MRKMILPISVMVLLWLPIIQMMTGISIVDSIDENRYRARTPQIQDLRKGLAFAYQVVADWFTDNYGLRDLLIRTKTEFDYSIFGTSDHVYLGSGDWMHYRARLDKALPLVESMGIRDIAAMVEHLGALQDYLRRRGITMFVIINPQKERFYPESMPPHAPRLPKDTKLTQIRAELSKRFGDRFIDVFPILMPMARKRVLFHKTDMHWNDPTAFEVARVLVDDVAKNEGRPLPYWMRQLHIVRREELGGESAEMPLFHPIMELQSFLESPWDDSNTALDVTYQQRPFNLSVRRKDSTGNALPTLVIFGDSFSNGIIRSGTPDYFQAFYQVLSRLADLRSTLKALPPDTKYFVFQCIEQQLPNIASSATYAIPGE